MTKDYIVKVLKENANFKPDIHTALSKIKVERMVEVGVRRGINFRNLIKCNPKLAVAVDCWQEVPGKPEYNDIGSSQYALDAEYNEVMMEFGVLPNVRIVRQFSIEAAEMFPNGYFDFVYLDAAHTYEEVLLDCKAWYPKVKKNGILAGHDYIEDIEARPDKGIWRGLPCGVFDAVNEFVKEKDLKVDHVTDYNLEGGYNEACTSFFVVKDVGDE
tara:strand:- start:53 stop:697 length:645 start_codon:yes stop_codon:yes gene_type:complete